MIESLYFPEHVKTKKVSSSYNVFRHPFVTHCFYSSLDYFEVVSRSHKLVLYYKSSPCSFDKNISYLIWFVFIRRGYIIGHKTPVEKSFSNINSYKYLNI